MFLLHLSALFFVDVFKLLQTHQVTFAVLFYQQGLELRNDHDCVEPRKQKSFVMYHCNSDVMRITQNSCPSRISTNIYSISSTKSISCHVKILRNSGFRQQFESHVMTNG